MLCIVMRPTPFVQAISHYEDLWTQMWGTFMSGLTHFESSRFSGSDNLAQKLLLAHINYSHFYQLESVKNSELEKNDLNQVKRTMEHQGQSVLYTQNQGGNRINIFKYIEQKYWTKTKFQEDIFTITSPQIVFKRVENNCIVIGLKLIWLHVSQVLLSITIYLNRF